MPRSLARLRYRTSAPSTLPTARRSGNQNYVRGVQDYVQRQSIPGQVKLQFVVNPKSRRQATGQIVPPPRKPFTLRDVVDPEGKTRHGQIIYVFRNTKSNQIIYSLAELLDNHHLAQLPFIGRHSKPPVLRPDEWTPHCVVTFPTSEQGHNAFRKLREFRKLHEMAWNKTNPKWKSAPIKERIRKIMHQRDNMSADLAEVLRVQEKHGAEMAKALDAQNQKAIEYLDKRWAEIDALASVAAAKAQVADNVKWLEHQIRSLTMKLNMKHNQNEADQKRLKSAKIIQEIRLRKVQYAQRKAEQLKDIQADLAKTAAPANEVGAQEKLAELRDQASVLKAALANPGPTRTQRAHISDGHLLAQHESEIKTLEHAFEAKSQLEARDHHIARSVLPPHLKKPLPTPYTLEGVSVQWTDLRDALYASGKWPASIEHEPLEMHKIRNEVALVSADEYAYRQSEEVHDIMEFLRSEAQPEPEPEPETGVMKYLSNPFKSVRA